MNYRHPIYATYADGDTSATRTYPKLSAKDFSYKSSRGYLVGYIDENSYLLVYIFLERKVSKPTVAVVFDERVPEPCTTYFDELTKYDYIELTGDYVSSDPKDYERLLLEQKYFDPEIICTMLTHV